VKGDKQNAKHPMVARSICKWIRTKYIWIKAEDAYITGAMYCITGKTSEWMIFRSEKVTLDKKNYCIMKKKRTYHPKI